MEPKPVEYSAEFVDQQKSHVEMGNAAIAGFLGGFVCHCVVWCLLEIWIHDLDTYAFSRIVMGNLLLAFFFDIPLALCCAWLSHRIFYRSSLSVTCASAALSIIAVLTLVGWAYLLSFIQ